MKTYTLYEPTVTKNKLNEEIKAFNPVKDIEAIISLNTRSAYNNNGSDIVNCDYVAFTSSFGITKGMMLDKYNVEFVVENQRGSYLYLKEVASDGKH